MSDLTATNCGCGNVGRSGCGCGNFIWIILLLFLCGGNGNDVAHIHQIQAIADPSGVSHDISSLILQKGRAGARPFHVVKITR